MLVLKFLPVTYCLYGTTFRILTQDVAPYISLYWASLMIGRWTGAVEAFTNDMSLRKVLRFLALFGFGVFLAVNAIAKHDLTPFYIYGLVILVLIAADIASKGNLPECYLFSSLGIVALVIGMGTSGMVMCMLSPVLVYSVVRFGLVSLLWQLAIREHTSQGGY
jgi:FHS family L-fucose permease-like MFS transporter